MSQINRSVRWWVTTIIVPFAVAAAVVAYLWSRRSAFDDLRDVAPAEVALVALLTVVAHFINAVEFGRLYRSVGARLGTVENWMLFTAGQLGNHLPAQLGTVYRFRYLKQRHGLALGSATAGYGANLLITILASGVTGLVGAVWLGLLEDRWSLPLLGGLAALVAIGVSAAFVSLPSFASSNRIARAWRSFARGWEEIRADRAAATTVLGLELLRSAITAWRLQLAFGWLGFDEPLAFFLVVGPTAALVTFIGFTPAGLGLREVAIGATAVALGRPFDDGLVGSSTDRAVSLVVVSALGLAGFLYTSAALRRHSEAESGGS